MTTEETPQTDQASEISDVPEFAQTLPPTEPPLPEPLAALPTWHWMREGLRAGVFLAPRADHHAPTPVQIGFIAALVLLLDLALSRLEVTGAVVFDASSWLAPWWSTAVLLLVAWWALPATGKAEKTPLARGGLPAWWALWLPAAIPVTVVFEALAIAAAHGVVPSTAPMQWLWWGLWNLVWIWMIAMAVRLAWRFVPSRPRLIVFAIALIAVTSLTAWQFQGRPWQQDYSQAEEKRGPRFEPSQKIFEDQQRLFQDEVAAIGPGRPGVTNVYGLVFAPYADEDVFLRESTMVAKVLAERFDAKGRVLHLVNHVSTTSTHPWATPQNLERAIDALAGRMDRERDVLVVYLTSHGGQNFKLAARHWPLSVDLVSPGQLRLALDKAGVKNRVIAISACYSGGWIAPLASDSTLVMTAADADHTSYGCGRLSELTFFGRAVFNEELRKSHSFESAFAAAVPLIRQREVEAGKSDGFSNPQISVGEKIRPVLEEVKQRLDGMP